MTKTICISEEVYARLEALARPFEDREPEDVIRRLLDGESVKEKAKVHCGGYGLKTDIVRTPRERGTIVELDDSRISATTVPDLFTKVMEFINSKGLWDKLESMAPYNTSAKRYLFAKNPIHPKGNDFFVELKYRNMYFEAHKNYETAIKQLDRLLSQLDIKFKYVR
jgi:hypothetical protein